MDELFDSDDTEIGQSTKQNAVCCRDFQCVGRYINLEHFQAHISYIDEYSHTLNDTHNEIRLWQTAGRIREHATWQAGSKATNLGPETGPGQKICWWEEKDWLRWRVHGLASDSLYSFVEAATLETELEHECNQMYYILCNLSGDWSAEDSWKKANDVWAIQWKNKKERERGQTERELERERDRERERERELDPLLGAMISWVETRVKAAVTKTKQMKCLAKMMHRTGAVKYAPCAIKMGQRQTTRIKEIARNAFCGLWAMKQQTKPIPKAKI